jgi:hypothetical protein
VTKQTNDLAVKQQPKLDEPSRKSAPKQSRSDAQPGFTQPREGNRPGKALSGDQGDFEDGTI